MPSAPPVISSRVSRTSAAAWLVAVPATLLAIAYGALMLRGPFDPLRAP